MEPNFWPNFLAEMGSKKFGGLNQKSGYLRITGIYSSTSCKNNHGKILIVAEVTRLEKNPNLDNLIWPFMRLLEAKIVILGPIDFLFGFPINLKVNLEQKKFVYIFKNVAKIANFRPKMGQLPL